MKWKTPLQLCMSDIGDKKQKNNMSNVTLNVYIIGMSYWSIIFQDINLITQGLWEITSDYLSKTFNSWNEEDKIIAITPKKKEGR